MAKVTLLFGNDPQGDFPLNKAEHTIGRARDCDILVDNLGVSRHHCSIVQDGSNWKLVDQGSNNGTFLNGEKVNTQVLANGDRIILGKYSLVFDAHGEADAPAPDDGGGGGGGGMGGEMTMFVDPDAIKKMQQDMAGGGGAAMQRMLLTVRSGGRDQDMPLVKSDTTIGKGEDADIVVKGFLVKAIQAKVVKTDTGHRILSLGGWRKVKVNNVVVQEGLLRDGDVIQIAGMQITYRKG